MLKRRTLVGLALALPVPAAAKPALDPITAELVALPDPDGTAPAVMLPARDARIAFVGTLAGARLIAVQFSVEQYGFVAFCGGARFSLRGVQLWSARMAGCEFGTILRLAGDASELKLVHDWARVETPTLWRREHWTDRFTWGQDGRLRELTTHAPPPDSAQAGFAASRAAIAALLPDPANFVPEAAIRLQTDSFSLASKAQPSMRQTPSGPRSIV